MKRIFKNIKNKDDKREFCIINDPLFVDELINGKKRIDYTKEEMEKLNNFQSQQQQIPKQE